ncbi:MAG: hypothetical protein ACOVRN_00460 [Flavobacterium sp.]
MSRRPYPKRLSVAEDIRLIREKNNIRKQELLNILHIEDEDKHYTLYELEQKLYKLNQKESEIRNKEIKIKNMLSSLGLDKNTQMDYNELEHLYQERLSLRERLKKQRDEFNNSQYRKKYPENNTITTEHFTSYTPSFHNPGGATIYTQANAANSMVFNQESGIYEPGDF